MARFAFALCISIFIAPLHSFLIPPPNVLDSTILSTSSSSNTPNKNIMSSIWQQPKFNEPFTSNWYYWQSTPGQKNNADIKYGTVQWIFNTTHMYYYFNIPSSNIQFHQYIINETYYLWTQNNTKINCFKYKFPFHIIDNYFKNSYFAGLTNSPDLPNSNSNPISTFMDINTNINNITNTSLIPTNDPTNSPSNSPTHSPTQSTTSPTLPTTAPTQPTTSPTLPTSTPTLPTSAPTQPTNAPTQPTTAPTQPTNAPTQPTNAPTLPTNAPTQPTSAPTQPTNAPTQPTSAPTQPTSAPTLPTGAPTLPTTAPTLPTTAPTLPTTAPTLPTTAPTQPTSAPTPSTDAPTQSPTEAPTKSPSAAPTNSPTRSPTSSPTRAPNFYPLQEPEAIWIGYLFTERVFGRNLTYIVTSNETGYIGHLYISLNTDDINLANKVMKSEIMWLRNMTYKNENENINVVLPHQCITNPDNSPTFAPSLAPTNSPTGKPTAANNLSGGGICHLPQPMIILYVVLITFFILLLFCWYAKKNNIMSRIVGGDEQSLAVSSDRYHNYSKYSKGGYGSNKVKKVNKSVSGSRYGSKKVYVRGNVKDDGDRRGKPFIGRKVSDRYVGDDDSDIEYNRKGSKVSSIDIEIPIGNKKNRMDNNDDHEGNDDKSDEEYQQ